jgi:hypothetical protein
MRIRVLKEVWQLLEDRLEPRPHKKTGKAKILKDLLITRSIVLQPPLKVDKNFSLEPEEMTEANSFESWSAKK